MVTPMVATSSASSVQESADPVVGAARYAAVPALMDSLLHDVRNPLNALAIHLEVLTEKLKGDSGQVPPSQDKNLRAMREQIQRVDGMLKMFSDFIVFRGAGPSGEAPLSEAAQRALDVLGHESRRRRLQVQVSIEADVRVRLADTSELGFFLIQMLTRAIHRSAPGSGLRMGVRSEDARAVLEVEDTGGAAAGTVAADTEAALRLRAAQLGLELELRAGLCRLFFPRA
ncbi:sensor histidine kinase [Citreicoccus inhibens]|uniref:sensor histidine kinase n=1 Tax=Citreicoccus inhibens TaxID=2849499 RepID=UPI0011C3A363